MPRNFDRQSQRWKAIAHIESFVSSGGGACDKLVNFLQRYDLDTLTRKAGTTPATKQKA